MRNGESRRPLFLTNFAALSSPLVAATSTITAASFPPADDDAARETAAATHAYENVAVPSSASVARTAEEEDEDGGNSDGTITNDSSPNAKTPSAADEDKQVGGTTEFGACAFPIFIIQC